MMRTKTSATLFAGFWFGLAVWQSSRGFARCDDISRWVGVYWGLHAVLLIAPLFAIRLVVAEGKARGPRTFDAALGLALLTYVPIMIAMRLLEMCVSPD